LVPVEEEEEEKKVKDMPTNTGVMAEQPRNLLLFLLLFLLLLLLRIPLCCSPCLSLIPWLTP